MKYEERMRRDVLVHHKRVQATRWAQIYLKYFVRSAFCPVPKHSQRPHLSVFTGSVQKHWLEALLRYGHKTQCTHSQCDPVAKDSCQTTRSHNLFFGDKSVQNTSAQFVAIGNHSLAEFGYKQKMKP